MQNYAAKIEWLAVREEALKMLAKGYSYRGVKSNGTKTYAKDFH